MTFILRTRGLMEWQLYTPPGTSGLEQRLVPETKKRGLGGVYFGAIHYWNGGNFTTKEKEAHRFRSSESAEKKAFYITTALMPSLIGELEVYEFVGRKVHKAPRKALRLQLQLHSKGVPGHLRRDHGRGRRGRGNGGGGSGRSLQKQTDVAAREARTQA
jgi:hypothetical protein